MFTFLMYSEVAWVLVSLGTHVQLQIIFDSHFLSDYFSVSYDYAKTCRFLICIAEFLFSWLKLHNFIVIKFKSKPTFLNAFKFSGRLAAKMDIHKTIFYFVFVAVPINLCRLLRIFNCIAAWEHKVDMYWLNLCWCSISTPRIFTDSAVSVL